MINAAGLTESGICVRIHGNHSLSVVDVSMITGLALRSEEMRFLNLSFFENFHYAASSGSWFSCSRNASSRVLIRAYASRICRNIRKVR